MWKVVYNDLFLIFVFCIIYLQTYFFYFLCIQIKFFPINRQRSVLGHQVSRHGRIHGQLYLKFNLFSRKQAMTMRIRVFTSGKIQCKLVKLYIDSPLNAINLIYNYGNSFCFQFLTYLNHVVIRILTNYIFR